MHYEDKIDEVIETAMMLSYGSDLPKIKAMMISILNTHDIDGERFFSMHLEECYQLIESFIKYRRIDDDETICFSIASFEFQGLLFLPLLLERSLLKGVHNEHKETIQKLLIQAYNIFYEADLPIPKQIVMDELFLLTKQMVLDEKSKWVYLTILYDPIPYYKQLCHILIANIPALHKAFKEHASYIEQCLQRVHENIPGIFKKNDAYTITPLISNPISILELNTSAYCGVLWHTIIHYNNDEGLIVDCDELAYILKVLADKTRLEILKLLKEAPSYNLEIAKKLALSPATVSHHMTALLMRKFVILEKRGGYTYYQLNQEVLSSLIQNLSISLL